MMLSDIRALIGQWLYDWQPLIAACLAILAALWATRGIRAQIRHAAAGERERQSREERAAKVVLSLVLSEMTRYAEKCILLLMPFVSQDGSHQNGTATALVPPTVTSPVLESLQASVRHADPSIVSRVGALVGRFQVQHARLRAMLSASAAKNQKVGKFDALQGIIDAADIYAKAAALFGYAREVGDLRRLATEEQLLDALHRCGVWDHAELEKLIRARTRQNADDPEAENGRAV